MSVDTLYHYCSLSGLQRIVGGKDRFLSCTHVNYFNDTAEMSYSVGLLKDVCDQRRLDTISPTLRVYLDLFSEMADQLTSLNIFVFCFSEEGDLLSQWRGYCPKEGGYSLGFDISQLFEQAHQHGFLLTPCIYDITKQKEMVSAVLDSALESVTDSVMFADSGSAASTRNSSVAGHSEQGDQIKAPYLEPAVAKELVEVLLDILRTNADPMLDSGVRLIALEYDVPVDSGLGRDDLLKALEVAIASRTKLLGEKLMEFAHTLGYARSQQLSILLARFLAEFLMLAPKLKNPGFAEEKEWRLISFPKQRANPGIHFYARPGNPTLVPYWKFQHTPETENVKLSQVYVGPTNVADSALHSLKWYFDREKVECSSVEKSSIPYRNW